MVEIYCVIFKCEAIVHIILFRNNVSSEKWCMIFLIVTSSQQLSPCLHQFGVHQKPWEHPPSLGQFQKSFQIQLKGSISLGTSEVGTRGRRVGKPRMAGQHGAKNLGTCGAKELTSSNLPMSEQQ